jgi:hypothetical protein
MGSLASFFANPFDDPAGALFDPGGFLGIKKEAPIPEPSAPSSVSQPSSVPSLDDKAPGEAAERQRRRQASAGGRKSTILTSPLGLTEPASTSRRQLLGR